MIEHAWTIGIGPSRYVHYMLHVIAISEPRAQEHPPYVHIDRSITSAKLPQWHTEHAFQQLHRHRECLTNARLVRCRDPEL